MNLNKIKKSILKHKHELQSQYSVDALYVFGSIARGEANKKSDIDLIVEFSSDQIGLFEFVRLKSFLESILHAKVDLVTRDAIKKDMIDQIVQDSVRVA